MIFDFVWTSLIEQKHFACSVCVQHDPFQHFRDYAMCTCHRAYEVVVSNNLLWSTVYISLHFWNEGIILSTQKAQ